MNKTLDSLDRKIISLLGEDGRMTVPKISEALEITNPTVRSRIKKTDGLYRFLTIDLPKVDGIRSTESFMIMKAKGKWIHLPQGMKKWFVNAI